MHQILHAPQQAEANCHSRIRYGLAQSFPFLSRSFISGSTRWFIIRGRPGAGYAQASPTNGEEIFYTLPFGKQTAFYIPARNNEQLPSRLFGIAFSGNGSLPLDWTTILADYPNPNDAFLLLDYPGYGKCQGYASIASTRAER